MAFLHLLKIQLYVSFPLKKKKQKNIQQRGFAGGHPPNY